MRGLGRLISACTGGVPGLNYAGRFQFIMMISMLCIPNLQGRESLSNTTCRPGWRGSLSPTREWVQLLLAKGTHFLPSGDCTLPALPPSEPDLDDHAADEYTDAVLQGEQVEHAVGVYETTTVADTCPLSLVAGSGPQVLHVPRDEAVRLTALAFGLAHGAAGWSA